MTELKYFSRSLLAAACLALFGHPALAMPMVFSGIDSGRATTNSEAQFALWRAAGSTPIVDDLDGLTGTSGVNGSFTSSLGNTFSTTDGDSIGLFNFSIPVLQGTSVALFRNGPVATLVWDVVSPIDSFGFFSRNQNGATISINFADAASPQTFVAAASNSTGDNFFWGITGLDSSVSSVEISTNGGINTRSLYDRFAYRQAAAVPEPTTLSLMLMACGIGAYRRCKR